MVLNNKNCLKIRRKLIIYSKCKDGGDNEDDDDYDNNYYKMKSTQKFWVEMNNKLKFPFKLLVDFFTFGVFFSRKVEKVAEYKFSVIPRLQILKE